MLTTTITKKAMLAAAPMRFARFQATPTRVSICVLIVATILVVIFSVRSNIKDAKRAEQEELAKEQGSN